MIQKMPKYKAGYVGSDSMRTKAENLLKHEFDTTPMERPSSFSSPDKSKMRLFKKGGAVRGGCHKGEKHEGFAAGGVAKIRHGVATPAGLPILKKRRKGR